VLFALCAGCGGGFDDGARLVGSWTADAVATVEPEKLDVRGNGLYAHGIAIPGRYRWDAGAFVADGAVLHLDGRDAYDGSAVQVEVAYRLDGDALTLAPLALAEALATGSAPGGGARVLHRVAP
jgi:hypothetical protein